MKHPIRVLLAVLALLVAGLAAGACGGAGTGGELSDVPPWGLDTVEMPDTQEDVEVAFASFPEEVGGRSRSGWGRGAVYGESVVAWSIGAMDSETLQTPNPGEETAAGWVADFASRPGGATVEASAVDLNGDLVWVASSAVMQDLSEDPPVGGPIYMLSWAKPDGSWAFSLQADSEAGRKALAHAFVTATVGTAGWVVNALVIVIVLAVGWWVFRYARSASRGDYRHPKDLKQTWWVAGSGSHGGGGQVPPLLPSPDPEDEIR
jgi:hypothetical protein